MFDLHTRDVDGYETEDGNDADAHDEEEASEADDGSTHNVEDWWHSMFDLGTSNFDWYEGENGDYAGADKEEEALEANDWSTQNVEDWGHSTRECEDWTVYFRCVKYNNAKAIAMASDVFKATTV